MTIKVDKLIIFIQNKSLENLKRIVFYILPRVFKSKLSKSFTNVYKSFILLSDSKTNV